MLQIPSISERVAAGEEFTAEWPVQSANNDGKVKASGNDAEQFLTGEKQTITGKVELKDDVASFVIGMGWVGLGNTVQFYQPTIKDKDGNIVYPPEEPTTEEPTTQAPTQEPTTVAPTVKPSVMPTAVPVVKVPEKALIKKIYKKKKSAKKIKIKIKKIKDAKGYQVAIYKSKKKAKKNKKALVKKYVKYKKKITIKSKKLKKKKKLYVRARAYTLDGVKKVFGPWSKVKKAKIKK